MRQNAQVRTSLPCRCKVIPYETGSEKMEAMRPQKYPELMTVKQAASMLNVSRRTVTRLCESGQLKSIRVGGQWRINTRAIRRAAGLED